MLRKRRFGSRCVRKFLDVPRGLAERCAGVLIAQGWLRLALIAMYVPTRAHGDQGRVRGQVVANMALWLSQTLHSTAGRYIPVVAFDCNDTFEHGEPWVGPYGVGAAHDKCRSVASSASSAWHGDGELVLPDWRHVVRPAR